MTPASILEDLLPQLERWYAMEIFDLWGKIPEGGPGTILSCPIWGNYVERFRDYCLPTLMAGPNIAALATRGRFVLYTDAASGPRLLNVLHPLVEKVGHSRVIVRLIPPEVMAYLPGPEIRKDDPSQMNRYWILGIAGQAALKMAGRCGMSFHHLYPDVLFSPTYFPELFAKGEEWEAIAQTTVSVDLDAAASDIEKFRQPDRTLLIPHLELGTLGLKHLHAQTRANLMNSAGPDDLPETHMLIWQGRDKLWLYSPHMNAIYLSARLCASAPSRIPATIDAELPAFIRDTPFYVPQAGEMTCIEVSDGDKGHNPTRVDFPGFARRAWAQIRFNEKYMTYFERPCCIGIKPQHDFVADDTIQSLHAAIVKAMRSAKPAAMENFIDSLAFNS